MHSWQQQQQRQQQQQLTSALTQMLVMELPAHHSLTWLVKRQQKCQQAYAQMTKPSQPAS